MGMINWIRKSANEQGANHKGLELREKKMGNLTMYFIEKDGEVIFNGRDKFDFLRHVELYTGERKHLSIKQNRL